MVHDAFILHAMFVFTGFWWASALLHKEQQCRASLHCPHSHCFMSIHSKVILLSDFFFKERERKKRSTQHIYDMTWSRCQASKEATMQNFPSLSTHSFMSIYSNKVMLDFIKKEKEKGPYSTYMRWQELNARHQNHCCFSGKYFHVCCGLDSHLYCMLQMLNIIFRWHSFVIVILRYIHFDSDS